MKPKRSRPEKQFAAAVAVAVVGAAIAGALVTYEQLSAPPPERTVTIYRTHGCSCAFAFAKSLTAAGLDVRLIEEETLNGVRAALKTPSDLHGCHVGVYLGYFLEGHIAASALSELALERPTGLGVATTGSANPQATHVSIALEEQSPVLLLQSDGTRQRWFQPNDFAR